MRPSADGRLGVPGSVPPVEGDERQGYDNCCNGTSHDAREDEASRRLAEFIDGIVVEQRR